MKQGADGHLLMCDPYTPESQQCQFFLPLWYILGLISRITHCSLPLVFHVARLFAALMLLGIARSVTGVVMKSRSRVRYALLLYSFSGGLGWLVFTLKNRNEFFGAERASGSADLDLPEAIAFRSMFSQVHFVMGVVLVASAIYLAYRGATERSTRRMFAAGAVVSLLAVVHPYMVVVVVVVSVAIILAQPWLSKPAKDVFVTYRAEVLLAAAMFVGMIPGVAYASYLNSTNEVLREWLRVTDTFSPPPWEYALGFGVVGLLGVLGLWLLWKGGNPAGRMLVLWAFIQSILLYLPISIQRRFVEGLQLPLSIAASVAVFWIARQGFSRTSRFGRRLLLVGVVVFASLTNIGFLIGQIVVTRPTSIDSRRYVSLGLMQAFGWLKTARPDSILFSSYLTGNIAPSMTGLRVFLGHYAQTLSSDEKGTLVTAFYTNSMTDEEARQLFTRYRVRFIVYGQYEREISSTFEPPRWLKVAFQNDSATVFEVPSELSSTDQPKISLAVEKSLQ